MNAELRFDYHLQVVVRHVTRNTGSNMVERMIRADLADTDVLQFEENQDLGLGTQ